jgi:Protein of unknown function DUF262/Protein of unknown function (DUF1524)
VIRSVNPYAINAYFNPDEAQSFFIPKYQREYVWRWDNWESLFDDLEDAGEGYFLGSIICVNTQDDALQGNRLELIDGQQRFMTICLLFCALYQALRKILNPDEDLHVELANLKRRLFVKGTRNWRFVPTEQSKNKDDFQYILSQNFPDMAAAPRELSYFGNRRLAKAYSYFCNRINELNQDEIIELLEKLKSAILVKIEVPSHADAFVLFETINNRGVPLSAIDIIKNNLLAALDQVPNYGIDRAFDEWTELIELLPDLSVQERFLRQLYNGFKYLRRVQVRGCPRATRSNLITIYDTLLRKRPAWLFREMMQAGRLYAALLDPEQAVSRWGFQAADALRDLGHLGAAPGYTFLLWAAQVTKDNGWDQCSVLKRLAQHQTRWFFWRNLTDVPSTRDLDPMFIDLIDALLKSLREKEIANEDAFVAAAVNWLNGRAAPAEVREMKLDSDLYEENYDATRFMLCKIEESHQTRETRRDLWVKDNSGKSVFTVEHILPRAENLTPGWIAMLADGNAEGASAIREQSAQRLGNLTLSGYNANLGKMNFQRKRDRKNENGDLIGYRNGLYLNLELATRDDWNKQAITNRTKALCEEVRTLFALDGPA